MMDEEFDEDIDDLHPAFDQEEHDDLILWLQEEIEIVQAGGEYPYYHHEIIIHIEFLLRMAREQKQRADDLESKHKKVLQ